MVRKTALFVLLLVFNSLAAATVSLNSPANNSVINGTSTVTLNWTPSGFSSNPMCNVSRGTGSAGVIDFTSASDYFQEDAADGTAFANSAVKLYPSSSSSNLSCTDILSRYPSSPSGSYWIDPDGAGTLPAFEAYCDMSTSGGGWTLVANKRYGYATTTTSSYLAPGNNDRAISDGRWQALNSISDSFLGLRGSDWVVFNMTRMKNANCQILSATLAVSLLAHHEDVGCIISGSDYCLIGVNAGNRNTLMDWECATNNFHISNNMGLSNTSYWWEPPDLSFYAKGGISNVTVTYSVSQPFYVTTSNASQIKTSDWLGVSSVSINQTTPASTSIKYLLSFDGRNTWKFFNSTSSAWQAIPGDLNSSLGIYGMGKSEVEALTLAQWGAAGGFAAGMLDFAADLSTSNSSVTPELDRVTVYQLANTVFSAACTSDQLCTTTNHTENGNYSWSVTCYSGTESATSETRTFSVNNILPLANTFDVALGTTNFSAVQNIANISNLTLANADGKMKFHESCSVNATLQNYDANVRIGRGFISINTAALNPTFNCSAQIMLQNVTCPATLFYGAGVFSSREEIIAQRNVCDASSDPACTGILCENSTLVANVSHFTGFAASSSANLTIWDETDSGMPFGGQVKYANDSVRFFANYTNSTGAGLDGANCTAWFADSGWNAMAWNSTGFYQYSRNFATNGTFYWNASCSKSGFDSLSATDSVLINATGGVNGTSNQTSGSAISLRIKNKMLSYLYLSAISLDGETTNFSPPISFAPSQTKIISFNTTRVACAYPGMLVQFDVVLLYYTSGAISSIVQAGDVPLILKCS